MRAFSSSDKVLDVPNITLQHTRYLASYGLCLVQPDARVDCGRSLTCICGEGLDFGQLAISKIKGFLAHICSTELVYKNHQTLIVYTSNLLIYSFTIVERRNKEKLLASW